MTREMQLIDGCTSPGIDTPGPSTERIEQLEFEIETRRAELNRLKAAANGETKSDAQEIQDEPGDPHSYSEHLRQSLWDIEIHCLTLNALWEQRLAGSTRQSNSKPGGGAPPTTIYTSPQNDVECVVSNNATFHTPSPRETRFLGHIRSSFRSTKRSAFAAKSNDLEIMVRERDTRIEELKAVIYSNIEIINKMKDTFELIAKGEETGYVPVKNITELKENLINRINEESTAASSSEGDQTMASKGSTVEEEDENLRSMISELQYTVQDMDSTISLQGTQNETLKAEIARLSRIINDMEDRSSSQEDEIENLRAEMVKLEFSSQVQDNARRIVEDDLSMKLKCHDKTISNLKSSWEKKVERKQIMMDNLKKSSSLQEDYIETLKAEIMNMKLMSDLQEEEKRNAAEEMITNAELSQIEFQIHDIL